MHFNGMSLDYWRSWENCRLGRGKRGAARRVADANADIDADDDDDDDPAKIWYACARMANLSVPVKIHQFTTGPAMWSGDLREKKKKGLGSSREKVNGDKFPSLQLCSKNIRGNMDVK